MSASTPLPSPTRQLVRDEVATWMFVARTLLALFVAGWVSMRLQMEQPATAMMTTIIVMNRQSGMVLAKSFYRAIGTVIGACMALLLMGLFPQQREPLLLATALWLGLCAGGATLFRNFKSYAFVLSGYTAAIILLPAIDQPTHVFNTAVARVGEVLLGLLVSAVISDTVFPTKLREELRSTARDQFRDFIAFVRDSVGGGIARDAMEKAHLRFVRDAVTLEDLRSSVVFEDAETRARSAMLLLFNQRFMAVSTSFQSLHHLPNRLLRGPSQPVAEAVFALYRPLAEALQPQAGGDVEGAMLLPRVDAYLHRLGADARQMREQFSDPARCEEFDTANALLHRFVGELRAYIEIAAHLAQPGARSGSVENIRFTRGNDLAGASITVLRAVLVMLVLGGFWILTAWPSGGQAMLIATIFCGLFGASAQPAAASRAILMGFLIGAPVGFAMNFFVLPWLDGFPMLVMAMLPFCIPGLVASTFPRTAASGTGYMMALISMTAISNPMHFDPALYVNSALAQIVGAGFSVAAFQLAPSAIGTRWMRQRQLAALRRQVAIAAHAPLAGLRHRFESVNRDLFTQIVASTQPGSDDSRGLLAWALAVNETGRALIALRHDAVELRLAPSTSAAIGDVLVAIGRLFESPAADRFAVARKHVQEAINVVHAQSADVPRTRRLLQHLHLLRIGLTDADSALAIYLSPAQPEGNAIQRGPHAV